MEKGMFRVLFFVFLSSQSWANERLGPSLSISPGSTKTYASSEREEKMLMDQFIQIGPKPGGNVPGGLYQLENSDKKFIIKHTSSTPASKNEVLAANLYKAAGVPVPNIILVNSNDGKNSYVGSEFIHGLKEMSCEEQGKRADILDGFIIDAWLGNYDIIGIQCRNIYDHHGKSIRVDLGASLLYEASGKPKLQSFDKQVLELRFLLNRQTPDQKKHLFSFVEDKVAGFGIYTRLAQISAIVFSQLTWENIQEGYKKLNSLSDKEISQLVNLYGPGDSATKQSLIALLLQRRQVINRSIMQGDLKKWYEPKKQNK